jgi:transcriptional regulator with XRE-family HTH domain
LEIKLKKEDFKVLFGKKLEQLRIQQNLTYRSMAERCDVDSSDISKIEKGKVDIRLNTILELSKGLNIHPKELFDFTLEF